MTVLGKCVEVVAPESPDFTRYSSHFSGNLVKLYRISYVEVVPRNLINGGWTNELYFHGTGHCGCLGRRAVDTISSAINSSEWCGNANCATQGILNYGHLRTWSRGGHFFSPHVVTANTYARSKSSNHPLLSFFMCKVRNFCNNGESIYSVQQDSDIHPCFLAIVRGW